MPSERNYLARVQEGKVRWLPQSEKQWEAVLSRADELFYGGAAGGGKSDLVIGMAVELHQQSAIFRRVYPNLKAIISRTRKVLSGIKGENKSEHVWNLPDGRVIEFGAVQHEDSKTDWQGRAHDLKAFDEITEFTESQYIFICGWNRTTDAGQRTRVICTGNPPIDEAGSWVVRYWAPWLDPQHPHPAKPGELRWFATVDGKDTEFPDGQPIKHKGEMIYPRSRTFIPAKLQDNPYLVNDSRYIAVLQSLPEPLRSMFLKGDFNASQAPDPFQVIPTDWVRAAQRRWMEMDKPKTPLTAAGLDCSRGGPDKTALALRYDEWFDQISWWPGVVAKDGPTVAALVQSVLGDMEPIYMNVDVAGVGSSVYDNLVTMYDNVNAFNAAEGSQYRDRSGKLKMRNRRAEMYWRMRDALDPELGDKIALPPGNELLADLCAAKYENTVSGVQVEKKADIKERIGRSPDLGEAVMMANFLIDSAGVVDTSQLDW